jgi:hypothetical protein
MGIPLKWGSVGAKRASPIISGVARILAVMDSNWQPPMFAAKIGSKLFAVVNRSNSNSCRHLLRRNTSSVELPVPVEIPGHRLYLHENNK